MRYSLALALLLMQGTQTDYQRMLAATKVTLADAIGKSMAIAKEGTPVQAELEVEKGKVVWSLDISQGDKTRAILLDAGDGSVVEDELDAEDLSAAAKGARITLANAVAAATRGAKGKPVYAELTVRGGKPQAVVKLFESGSVSVVAIDAVTGTVVAAPAHGGDADQDDEDRFTKTFGEETRDLGPTGRNPFFILEVGYTLVLEGKDEGEDAKITITVLDETKTIDGVEARAVEEREEVGGQLKEVTKDYFAISKRTNNVYYLGEAVDEYKDGKVAGHPGAWLSGENGARYGLIMLATPVLGARYYQEVAPGVAMDRAEVKSLTGKFECPAGKFDDVLETEETTPLEKGERETKRYARGVGLLYDGGLRLTRYGVGVK